MPGGHARQCAQTRTCSRRRRPARRFRGHFRDENFGWANALECRRDLFRRDFRETQRAARQIEPREPDVDGHAAPVVARADRHQVDVVFVREEGGVRERAGRDHAHDLALDRALRRGRVADLFADRHRLAELHELGEVLLDGVMRHASHLDRIARRRATLRKRQIEQARGFLGVFEEQLVEVAHPVEHERARVIGLDAQVLLHHGGVLRDVAGAGGVCSHPRCLAKGSGRECNPRRARVSLAGWPGTGCARGGSGGTAAVHSSTSACMSTVRAFAALRRMASQIIAATNRPNTTMIHCTGIFAVSSSA